MLRTTATMHTRELPRATDHRLVSANPHSQRHLASLFPPAVPSPCSLDLTSVSLIDTLSRACSIHSTHLFSTLFTYAPSSPNSLIYNGCAIQSSQIHNTRLTATFCLLPFILFQCLNPDLRLPPRPRMYLDTLSDFEFDTCCIDGQRTYGRGYLLCTTLHPCYML